MTDLETVRAAVKSLDAYPEPDDVQQVLAESLAATLTALPDMPDIKLSNENAKWRVLSSLQKAVRRGNVKNAQFMAAALINSGQEKHLLNRICTIALEDVAFGNPMLCAKVFCFASGVKVRKSAGGWPRLLQLIAQLCESVKDRIPCEIAVSAGFSPADDEYKRQMYALSTDEIVALTQDGNHWQDMQTAMRFLAGQIKMNGDFMAAHRDMKAFRRAFADCPALIRYIAHRSAASGGESASLVAGMRMGWKLIYGNPETEELWALEEGDVSEPVVVKGILLEALDMHTQEGKQAFRTCLKQDNEGREFAGWVESLGGNVMESLGNGIFMVEGKQCDRRLWSPDVQVIRHTSHVAQMGRCGLPPEELDTLLSTTRDLIPALNARRAWVLRG